MLEVTIAVVIFTLLMVGAMHFNAQQITASRYVASSSESSNTLGNVRQVISNETNCANALRNGSGNATLNRVATPAATLTAISLNGTNPVIEVGTRMGDLTVQSMEITVQNGPTLITTVVPNQNRYLVQLTILLTRAHKTLGGGDKRANYLMNVFTDSTTNPENIVSCSLDGGGGGAGTGGTTLTSQDVCGSLSGGVWDAIAGRCQLTIEQRTTDPANPLPGQMWIRTDL